MRKSFVVALVSLAACAPPPGEEAAPPAGEAAGPVLPFLADDYPAARAEAQERDLPVFVESWAPW
jgi:hypothetical protein